MCDDRTCVLNARTRPHIVRDDDTPVSIFIVFFPRFIFSTRLLNLLDRNFFFFFSVAVLKVELLVYKHRLLVQNIICRISQRAL